MKDTYPQQNKSDTEKRYIVKVYNTFTQEYEDVQVTREVYEAYRRTKWRIENNNASFYDHEIQFSGLIGGENDNFENFKEFISEETPEDTVISSEFMQIFHTLLSELNEKDRLIMKALFIDGISEREYSRKTGIPQKTINNRKRYFLCKLEKQKIF